MAGDEERVRAELEHLRQELRRTELRAAVLRAQIEWQLRRSNALVDTSRRLCEESEALVTWRRSLGARHY